MSILENVFTPIIVMLIAAGIIIFFKSRRKNASHARSGLADVKKDLHYDEMQLKIRASGYKTGFFVTLIVLVILALLTELTDSLNKIISPSFSMLTAGFAGIVAFAVYCIFKDAFYAVEQKRKPYIILCICVIAASVFGSIGHIRAGSLLEDGMVKLSNCGTLLCALSFTVILISLIIKEVQNRKEVDA